MYEIRVKNRNVEEAIEEALVSLKATIGDVEIEVINKGILKFGGLIKKDAEVFIKLKPEVVKERKKIEKEEELKIRQLEETKIIEALKKEREAKEKKEKEKWLEFINENGLKMATEDEISIIKDNISNKNRIETIYLIRKSFNTNVETAKQLEKMLGGGSLL